MTLTDVLARGESPRGISTAFFQGAPPCFNYRLRELQLREGQQPTQDAGVNHSSTSAFTFTRRAATTSGTVPEGRRLDWSRAVQSRLAAKMHRDSYRFRRGACVLRGR